MSRRPPAAAATTTLGLLALAGYAIHSAAHVLRGTPEGMLWLCNVATLVVGVGLLLGRARIVAIGVSWLVIGDFFWALDVLSGGEMIPTSLLTHILGLAVGIAGLRRARAGLGFPARTWPLAGLGFAALQELTRWVTPAYANVNVAFSMYAGSEGIVPSYGIYRSVVLVVATLGFALVETAARRLLPEPTPAPL